MTYLSTAVALVGVLAALNLVFTVGVVRRLREHTEKLAIRSTGPAVLETTKAVGEQVGEFATSTIDGVPLSRAALSGRTLFGFFMAQCPPCHDTAPKFAELVQGMDGDRHRALAVVVGDGEDATAFAVKLTDAAHVVIEPDTPNLGPVATAFGVTAFPSFCVVDDQGVVVATGNWPDELHIPTLA